MMGSGMPSSLVSITSVSAWLIALTHTFHMAMQTSYTHTKNSCAALTVVQTHSHTNHALRVPLCNSSNDFFASGFLLLTRYLSYHPHAPSSFFPSIISHPRLSPPHISNVHTNPTFIVSLYFITAIYPCCSMSVLLWYFFFFVVSQSQTSHAMSQPKFFYLTNSI